MSAVQKGGFAHFMLKEIHEQPQVAREVLHMLQGSPEVQTVLDKISRARHVYFIGCGTSYHACLAGSVYFAQLAHIAVIPVLAPQFVPNTCQPSTSRMSVCSSASRARPKTC